MIRTPRLALRALTLLAGAVALSCGEGPTEPHAQDAALAFGGVQAADGVPTPAIVISQVYGAGGNSGATLKNDFIELFNPGPAPVTFTNWSVQYASVTGTTWAVTTISGTIPPGGYYLVQEAAGTGGTVNLPTPDATGGINMSGTSGKVLLASTTTAQSGACPSGGAVLDQVSFGTAANNCGSNTATLAATTAAIRLGGGCTYSGVVSADFTVATANPRNSASPVNPCGPPVPLVTVTPATPSIAAFATQQFTAAETLGGSPVSTSFSWTSSNTAVATISAAGLATGVAAGTTTITATASDGITGTTTLTVTSPVVASVTVTPATTSGEAGSTQQFAAAAKDGGNNPITTTFTWTSDNTAVATVDGTGLVTAGTTPGTATIKATAPNGVVGTATFTTTPTYPIRSGDVVISQVYGGGGNGGATYTNDYIELFNRSAAPVNLAGWSVQYASSAGNFTQATPLTGTIAPGAYLLVQEATNNATIGAPLPTPDVTGTINLSGSNGKVLLAQTATAFNTLGSAGCPTGTAIVDIVAYGSVTGCGAGNATATLSATTAALRKAGGCTYTPNPPTDFAVGAPAPRNSASPTRSCVAGPLDHVTVTGNVNVFAGSTSQLVASAFDAIDNPITGATFTWTSDNTAIATVDGNGLVTGVEASGDNVTITVTATAGGVTKTATASVHVGNVGGINWIDVSSSSTSMPPGFQTQLFITARDAQGGNIIPATFTFEALTPQYAVVNTIPTGNPPTNSAYIFQAVGVPTDGSKPAIRITATPTGGGVPYTFTSRAVAVEAAVSSGPGIYGTNDEFGDPTPASTTNPNDFLIRRDQYVISYNQSRGTPNWVSYELDARQVTGSVDRCNCFTADPLLPAAARIYTSDYTGGGFDRGHMARSFDRSSAIADNATTFYLTNIVPQLADLNQGVWATFENWLGDSARVGGRAVYIVTGPMFAGPLTYVNGAGKIAIPTSTWKVALIGPRFGGNPFTRANLSSFSDIPAGYTILAVNMPNVAGIRNDSPTLYFTTVEAIEEATGYDLFSALSQGMTAAIEYHDRAPVAQFTTAGTQAEGSPLTFDASASTDPDLGRTDLGGRTEALTYSWNFGDGTTATGAVVSKTFADNGSYTVTLTVTDAFGWPATRTMSVAVANVAPTATFTPPASTNEGAPFTLALTGASDASSIDAASLQFAFDCGDGAGYGPATAAASVSCAAPVPGTRNVRARVIDKDGGATEYTGTVVINNVPPAIAAFPGATIIRGETYASAGSFTDPGTGPWTATVNYADGGGAQPLGLAGQSFSLAHQYVVAGAYAVTVAVSDGYATSTAGATVTVLSAAAALDSATAMINRMVASGALPAGNGTSLKAKVDAAAGQVAKGNAGPAINQLNALLNEIDALEGSGRLPAADAAALRAYVTRIRASLAP